MAMTMALCGALAGSGCSPAGGGSAPGSPHAQGAGQESLVPPSARYVTPEGKVRVVGYNDMDQMLEALGGIFEERHPGIRFEWVLEGTRFAPPPLIDGTSAFAPMGAEMEPVQLAAWKRTYDQEPLAVPVAHDSLTPGALSSPTGVFVHASNPVHSISMEALRRAIAPRPGEKRVERWHELGVPDAAGHVPIRPVGLEEDTAIGALMLRRLGSERYVKEFVRMRQSRDVAAAVAQAPDALGIANLNHASPEIRALTIVDDSGREVAGDAEGIRSGLYPLDRQLLVYVRQDPGGRVEPLAHAFLCLALSEEGQGVIAAGSRGYLPLNPQEIAAARQSIGGCP